VLSSTRPQSEKLGVSARSTQQRPRCKGEGEEGTTHNVGELGEALDQPADGVLEDDVRVGLAGCLEGPEGWRHGQDRGVRRCPDIRGNMPREPGEVGRTREPDADAFLAEDVNRGPDGLEQEAAAIVERARAVGVGPLVGVGAKERVDEVCRQRWRRRRRWRSA
jgi:hypothetical protein